MGWRAFELKNNLGGEKEFQINVDLYHCPRFFWIVVKDASS